MPSKYTKDFLEPIVKSSKTWSEVCRKVGLKPNTGSHSRIIRRARELGVNSEHFVGKKWNLGRHFPDLWKTDEELFVRGSNTSSHSIKLQLFKRGIKKKACEECKRTKWLGQPIPLEVNHINGDKHDNRLVNLEIRCPNCHYFTPNYKSK